MIKTAKKFCACLVSALVAFTAFPLGSSAEEQYDEEASAGIVTINVSKESANQYYNGISGAVQEALDTAAKKATDECIYRVVVEPGEYSLNNTLVIGSNTWLSMKGVTFRRAYSERNMLFVGNRYQDEIGYIYRNITIEGGTFNGNALGGTMLKAGHAKNLRMNNVTLTNCSEYHIMEVGGVDGFTVTNCVFSDQKVSASNTQAYEALQLDVLIGKNMNGYRSEDLCNKNVLIENCRFSNCPRGVGSHTSVFNNPHSNIVIRNNTFTNMGSVAVQTLGWAGAYITSNTFEKCPRAIAVYTEDKDGTYLSSAFAKEGGTKQHYSDKYELHWANVFITDNVINNCGVIDDKFADYEKSAISVMGSEITSGSLPKGIHPCVNVAVKHNKINMMGNGVRIEYAKNIVVEGNVIHSIGNGNKSRSEDCGVVMRRGVSNTYINKNHITDIPVNAIKADGDFGRCSVKQICDNEIYTTGKYGIGFYSSEAALIKNNDIRNTVSRGLFMTDASKVTDKISENRFMNITSDAVRIDDDSSAKLIDKNTFYNCYGTINASYAGIGTNYTSAGSLSSFSLSDSALTLKVRECGRVSRSVSPVNSIYNYSYKSSNTSVASVDKYGLVTALKAGKAKITVSATNGKSKSFDVTVVPDKPSALLGDIDGDGYVTPVDYAVLAAYTSELEGYVVRNADVNGDGAVNAADRVVLARYIDRQSGFESLPKTLSGSASARGAILVSNGSVTEDGLVAVTVSLDSNPGTASLDFDMVYDGSALKLESVQTERFIADKKAIVADRFDGRAHFSVINDTAQADSLNKGAIATLFFRVSEDAKGGSYSVAVEPTTFFAFNSKPQAVLFDYTDGVIEAEKSGGKVSGRVTAANPADAAVELFAEGSDEPLMSTAADGEGSYCFEGVLSGSYTVKASKSGYVSAEAALTVEGDTEAQPLELILIGDINRDGKISIDDATSLQRHLAEYLNADGTPIVDEADPVSLMAADLSGDGKADIADVTIIQRYVAEYIA